MSDLKQRALQQLRDWREEHGDCYHGIDILAQSLGCDELELLDENNETGVLYELENEGSICLINNSCAYAVGRMEWELW